jgi:diguanylate cyclase (GGDEF)-like protein
MSLHLNSQKLQFRITQVVVLLCILSAILLAYIVLISIETKMKDVVGSQQYSLVSSAATFVERDIEHKKLLLRSVSDYLKVANSKDDELLKNILRESQSLDRDFVNVVVVNSDGALVANMRDNRGLGSRLAHDYEFFQQTIKSRDSFISKPFSNPLSGKPVIVLTQPIVDESGTINFVIAGGVDLSSPRLLEPLENVKPGRTGYFFIIDNKGTVIQHPDQSRVLVNVSESGEPTTINALALHGFEGWKEGIAEDGQTALIAYKKIKGTPWLMGAVYPTEEAFAALSEARVNAWVASALVGAIAALTGLLITRKLLRPLAKLREKVSAITHGDADIETLESLRKDEIGDLSRAFFALSQQRAIAEAKLADLVLEDHLTGVGNRRKFEVTVATSLIKAERTEKPIALAYLDVDRFKSINDTYGHGTGDKVLIEFARRLVLIVRKADTVTRIAGDEFVVIYDTINADTEPNNFAERILNSIRQPFDLDGFQLSVTTSVGFAVHKCGRTSTDDLLNIADEALYLAKHAGRNTFAVKSTDDASAED